MHSRFFSFFLALSIILCSGSPYVFAGPSLADIYLDDTITWFPNATLLGPVEKHPMHRKLFRNENTLGAVFLSNDITPLSAYSGKPISTLIGLTTDARIAGLSIVAHEEPILLAGVKEEHLSYFVNQYVGLVSTDKVRINASGRPGYIAVDGIAGATITTMVLNRSIMQSAKEVANALAWPQLPESSTHNDRSLPDVTLKQRWQGRLDSWQGQGFEIGAIVFALFLLTLVMFFQDWLVRRPKLFKPLRYGFLAFTVVFVGYVFSAQLSIVNVLAFIQTYANGFTWETLMIDPGIFLIWAFVAISIILWGRGVYCGWLCPFGAMQELIHEAALRLRIPNFEFPPMIHERLWAIKYILLLLLIGISMDSFSTAARMAEIEPFKTSLTLKFDREWPFVVYACGLLIVSIFNSKFYCKYICTLGASLSILSRFKIFDWLRRRNECGKPCQACASKCQINAIKPTGEIIESECHYCFDCQLTYWDDHKCPPLVEKRKKQRKKQTSQLIKVVDTSSSH